VGVGELILVGVRETTVKYHSRIGLCLMRIREPERRQGQAGSLTGAVASQKVTEAPKGSLRVDGHHPQECKGRRELDCEADRPSRDESRA
jgi:hypothetical protein